MTTPASAPTEAMRVERCGACGARYNVTRLALGARFTCRRCGAPVAVGAGTPAAASRPEARSALLSAGGLAVVAAVLRALPGVYASDPEASVRASIAALTLPDAAALALLAAAGGLALTAAGRAGARGLLGALAVFVAVLLARAHGPATPVLRTTAPDLADAIGLVLLGGAALMLGSPRTETRGAARPWVLVGILVLVAAAASRFAVGSAGTSSLLSRRGDAARELLTAVWRGTAVPDGLPVAHGVVPDLATALAAALGLVVVAWPGRRGGALSRAAGRAAFALLLLAHVTGPIATLWDGRERWLAEGGATFVATQVGVACFEGGLVLWLLASATVAVLAHPRGGAPRGPAGTGALHALAAVAAAGTAILLADPTGPTPALLEHLRRTVGSLAGDGPTEPAVVVTLWIALAAATALATLVAPLRGRGAFVGGFAAAAACAADLASSVGGTPRVAYATLVAIAAGSTWARRGPRWDGRGNAATLAVAVALALLLVFPARADGVDVGPLPYPSALATWAAGVARATPATLGAFVAEADGATVTFALVAAVLASVAAVVGPRKPLAWALVATALGVAFHAPCAAFLATLASNRDAAAGPPLTDAVAAAAAALRQVPVAAILAGVACAADAAGGRPPPI